MLLVPPGREQAIAAIRQAAAEGRLNDKTEPFDPVREPQKLQDNILSECVNEIRGLDKLSSLKGPAFVTSNHFNPFDNGVHRTLAKTTGHGRLVAISQGTNFVMPGLNGFVLRNIDVIPLIPEPSYMSGPFRELMRKHLDLNHFVLIYPEQEMWFNYRKPRPEKRGAFLFAAEYNVPVIPTFVEMQDLLQLQTPRFKQVKLILHVLDPIFPDPAKSPRENSFAMCEADTYDFTPWDIAGWTGDPPQSAPK